MAYSLNDLVNELLGFDDLLLSVCHDQAVQIFVLVASVSSIGFALAFLDRALSANCNLGLRLAFHCFQSVTTGTDK